MPLCCHSPNGESPILPMDNHWACQYFSTGLPIKCHSLNKKTLLKPTLTQCISTQPIHCQYCVTIVPIWCHSDYQGTTTLPIHRQSSTTWLPLCCHSVNRISPKLPDYQWITIQPIHCQSSATVLPLSQMTTPQVYLTTNGNPLHQSIANPVPFYWHCITTQPRDYDSR